MGVAQQRRTRDKLTFTVIDCVVPRIPNPIVAVSNHFVSSHHELRGAYRLDVSDLDLRTFNCTKHCGRNSET
jgi:hypothetical protein